MTASVLFFAFSLAAEIPVSTRMADRFPAAQGDIEITPLLHSSVQIEHAGKVIQVDPWSAADLSLAKAADVIVITDNPDHHLDVQAIERLRKPGAPVIIPASGKSKVPDGVVLANGQSTVAAGIPIDAIAAYDVTGPPFSHPKGKGNGYVLTLGGKRIYFAGVGECTPEMQALKDIDVAFMSMNIPTTRMTPAATADCVKTFKPKVVYIYHYDQDTAARLANPRAPRLPGGLAAGLSAAQSLQAFKDAMRGESIEVRIRDWYSPSRP
jgi:L-ascorbate metabolism protein UlaG (beta-lactamase superfamily)